MGSAFASTVPEHGSTDVRVDGSLAGRFGVVAAETPSVGLRVVHALFETDQIHQTASSRRESCLYKRRLLRAA